MPHGLLRSMTMNRMPCISLISLALSISTVLAANPTIPERQLPGRYERITEDWPFSIETPLVPTPVKPDGPFTALRVGGIAKTIENGKEQIFVAISSKDNRFSFSLFGSEKGHDDICVAGVDWKDEIGKSRVTLKKENVTGIIGFDEVAIKTSVPSKNPTPKLNLNSTIPQLPPRTLQTKPPTQPNQGTDPARGQRVRVHR